MTYPQAYAKAKARAELTGQKHFVWRDKRFGHDNTQYYTARVTDRNWIHAIFSEIVFPNDGLVSTETAQTTMYALLHGCKESQ